MKSNNRNILKNNGLDSFFYERLNHLGNVQVVVSDKRISVCDEELEVDYFKAEVLSAMDYYPFGMMMPDRQWYANSDSSGYRFGFQNQEKDDEIKGVGNSVSFSYRIHDPRLGRFLSVDPLYASYPWNSPYSFAENRVIDGIELEGLEYLSANEAHVGFKNGELELKVENFNTVAKNAFNNYNNNSANWKPGEIGVSKSVGTITLIRSDVKVPDGQANVDGGTVAPDVSKNPAEHKVQVPKTQQSNGTKDDGRYKGGVYSGATTKTATTAKATLALTVISTSLVWAVNISFEVTKNNITEHSALAQKAMQDVQTALDRGLIPEKYQNTKDLANIANVVLMGVNNTTDTEIQTLGMMIYNSISVPFKVEFIQQPEGADNLRVSKSYITPKEEVKKEEEKKDDKK